MMPRRPAALRFALSWFFAALVSATPLIAAVNLREVVGQWTEKQSKPLKKAGELNAAGDMAKANQILIDLADKDGGGVAAFVIGNMLYSCVPAVSYRLHERALKEFPGEPAVALELAMEQHRKGEYAAAIINYKKALQDQESAHFTSLLAECLLRTGQLKEAVEAWKRAGHPSHHVAIDQAIYEIHGRLSPAQRRGDLIALIKAGDAGKFAQLIELDLHFDRDWWNSEVNAEALDADLKFAARQLGAKDPRYLQIALYASLARQDEPKAVEVRQKLTEAKLVLGENAVLPENSLLARALCELAVLSQAATTADLSTKHEAALRSRLAAEDVNALHLLCWFAADAKDARIAELDRIGWKEWQNPEFAASYVAGLVGENKLTKPDDPEMIAALAAAPEDHYLNSLRLQLAGEAGLTQEILVASIKAEYHQLSEGMGMRDSYTLKGLFHELGKKLRMTDKDDQ